VGVACAAGAYALVAGSPPLYETQAVLSAPAPALLAQYSRVISAGAGSAPNPPGLDLADLGDVAGEVDRVRGALGAAAARTIVSVDTDAKRGEVSVTARDRRPRVARLVADAVAQAIVGQRDSATAQRLSSAREQLKLVDGLAADSPQLRPRALPLRRQIVALDQLRRVPGGGMSLLRAAATPTRPVGPRATRDAVLAAVVGMLLAVTLRALWRLPATRARFARRGVRVA
jgi:hypothetical protein